VCLPRPREVSQIHGGPVSAGAKDKPLLLVLLLSAILSQSGCAGPKKQSSTGPFDRYPRSPALDAVVRSHTEAASDPREELLLLTTWFLDGDPRVAMTCRVRPDGHVSTFGYVYDEGLRNPRKSDLVPDQLATLRESIAALPASQQPSLQNLLVLSYRTPTGQWLTRTYDRTAPPRPVAELFTITGAPLQPPVTGQ
jgi:hypothetical protein